MADVGGPLSYYWRAITNIELAGPFMGYWHILALFSIASAIFLIFLSFLVLRAGPKRAKNRFMALMLLTEALRCATSMLFWVYAWPEGFLNILEPARVVYYTMSFQLFILYILAGAFYSEKEWAKKISESFRVHGLYLLPIFSFALILGLSHLLGGTSVAIGDIGWVYCENVGPGEGTTASGDPLPFVPTCPEKYAAVYPLTLSLVALGPLTKVLLFIPLIGAIVATVTVGRSQQRIKNEGDSNLIGEVRAVRLGFIGKTFLQITTTLILFSIILILGESPSLSTNPFNFEQDISPLLIALSPLMPTAVVLAALFEGLIFTYAVLKNDMFGIDEKLRKTFITAMFAGIGAILFLIATEVMESIFDQGWIGGVIIGLPLIVLRSPIVSVLSKFSSAMMPESHTNEELGYLEMYALATRDGKITTNERSMLNLQAKSYGIEEGRMSYLENWYQQEKLSESEQHINLSEKYGDSGINLMSVFGTTGEAPIEEKEIKKSFTMMDINKDGVISPNEFSNSPEMSKLPNEFREEIFSEIDLNEDGLLQYEEFRTIAQITESHILSESNIQEEESEITPTVKQQWTDDAGHTWRLMDDDSTMWWNGTTWQKV
tara:strand:+ start:510 stop:2324 length:1815 start_codon:yes stop_codon:yes gene_type:complete